MASLLRAGITSHVKRHMYFLIIVLLGGCATQLVSEDTITEYTVNGKGVLLHEDGSWEYSGKIGFYDVERNEIASIDEISIADLLPCTLIGVIDGDTIRVVFVDPPPGIQTEESVRLLGIDATELRGSTGSKPLATEAREFVIEQVADSTVYLAFESRWRGDFGRLLAYVFTSEGPLLNAEMLSRGLASVQNEEPCHFHQYFVTLDTNAGSETRGVWTTPMTGIIIIRQIFNDGRGEYVELWNRSDQLINLSGWYFTDEQRNRINIPLHTSIPANRYLYILSGTEISAPTSHYVYPTKAPIWNNTGDTARLYDEDSELVTEHSY